MIKAGAETTCLPLRQQLVTTSNLLAFGSNEVTRYAVERLGLVQFRVKGLTVSGHVGVIYRKGAYLPPVGRRFIDLLKVTAKEIVAKKGD